MKIAIDPGHGMSNKQPGVYDPGATHVETGQPFEEAAIALKYGLALRDICRSQNLDVFMTRDDASDHAPVRERARNAEQAGCDVFVSLHLNDVEDDRANGLEVLYGNQTCEALAKALQGALIKTTGFKNRGAKLRGDLAVLKFKGRAALIELGFIGNDGDRTVLLNPLKREQICKSIVGVITK
jgi:N-acetylmuramoyl-L-alanine amidase